MRSSTQFTPPLNLVTQHQCPNSRQALKRVANPLEIAHAILFLTGSESSFVTGAALAIDGGRTFH